jgi:hypothetical protein
MLKTHRFAFHLPRVVAGEELKWDACLVLISCGLLSVWCLASVTWSSWSVWPDDVGCMCDAWLQWRGLHGLFDLTMQTACVMPGFSDVVFIVCLTWRCRLHMWCPSSVTWSSWSVWPDDDDCMCEAWLQWRGLQRLSLRSVNSKKWLIPVQIAIKALITYVWVILTQFYPATGFINSTKISLFGYNYPLIFFSVHG